MGSLSQAKTLGGVGSILVLLGFIPYAGFVIAIIGYILTLVAIKYISEAVHDEAIFRNAIIALVVSIIAVAIVGVVAAASVFSLVGLRSTGAPTGGFFSVVAGIIVALAVGWILLIVSAIFLRRSYDSISLKLNVGMFRTAALVYLIGAALAIILVGFLVILIAQILFIVAYFSIPDTVTMSGSGMPPSPQGSTMMGTPSQMPAAGSKFCVKCGASLSQDTMFCPNCGASQPATNV